jgi:hypothetical protein
MQADSSLWVVVQVRKSSKHSVVKMRDLEEVLNVEDVQPYNINGDMVLFLTERPQMGKGKAGQYRCDHCDRALLHEAYRFCSLGCKVYISMRSLACSSPTIVYCHCQAICMVPYAETTDYLGHEWVKIVVYLVACLIVVLSSLFYG